jgi:hypothetical protein
VFHFFLRYFLLIVRAAGSKAEIKKVAVIIVCLLWFVPTAQIGFRLLLGLLIMVDARIVLSLTMNSTNDFQQA